MRRLDNPRRCLCFQGTRNQGAFLFYKEAMSMEITRVNGDAAAGAPGYVAAGTPAWQDRNAGKTKRMEGENMIKWDTILVQAAVIVNSNDTGVTLLCCGCWGDKGGDEHGWLREN
jgi:hypothetical protein